MITIEIAGKTYSLEIRYCRCGCGSSWRCMPTSPLHFNSLACQADGIDGGWQALMKATSKDRSSREIPADAKGEVSVSQLARILGVQSQTVYNMLKRGDISALPGSMRNYRFDLAQLRVQIANNKARLAAAVKTPTNWKRANAIVSANL